MIDQKIIVAIDVNKKSEAIDLAKKFDPKICRLKVGLELYTAEGSAVIEQLQKLGFDIFLDLKFHDIPNTVARACSVVAQMGIWMVNVHALGGKNMISAAKEAISKFNQQPLLTAVTILTSHSQEDLTSIGISTNLQNCVKQLTVNAMQAGCDGIVCSALETERLRAEVGPDFVLVTPGIRPANSNLDDQNRVVTPLEAVRLGSDYLVIGRPITTAKDPAKMLSEIHDSLKNP